MDKQVFQNYIEFILRLDGLCEGLYAKLKDSMQCNKRCTMCCISGISVLPVEAYYIAENMARGLPGGSEPSGEINGKCVFLHDGLCSIYPFRPVLCRTQGFPLLYGSEPHNENEHNYELSYCELNFKDAESFEEGQLIEMERVNLSLAAINVRFLHETGILKKEAQSRIRLKDIVNLKT